MYPLRSADVKIFVNLETKERQYTAGEEMCPQDGHVTFFNSCLVAGRLGKVTLGGGNKSGLFQVSTLEPHSPWDWGVCVWGGGGA